MSVRSGRLGRATIKMVAEAAGVSPATVSRAFSRPEMLLATTVTRVRSAAAELGYLPDHSARALRTGTRGTVALVVPDIANAFFPPLIRAVQAAAVAQGWATVLGDTDEDPAGEAPLVRKLGRQADGVILASSRMPEAQILELAEEMPMVLVNREQSDVPRVLIDSGAGVREALEHLADLGHTSLAYVSGPVASWSDRQRSTALRAAAQERGVRLTVLPHRRPEPGEGRAATDEVCKARATAVIAFDDILAQGLLTGLADRGLQVPGNVSVVGCDDTIAAFTTPPLTSVRAPTGEAGMEAVGLLSRAIQAWGSGNANPEPGAEVRLPSSLVVRGTTAAASA